MTEFYRPAQRELQDHHDTRPLADRLTLAIIREELDDAAAGFIASSDFFFLSTVDDLGQPTVSHKGGAPGFVQVLDPATLLFPNYNGNGMYLSMGNIAGSALIGMLFMDFETPHRIRVQARATIRTDDDAIAAFPGADMAVEARISRVFVNCPRYIHRHARVAPSPYVPDADGNAPLPGWKRIDAVQDVLTPDDAARVAGAGGTMTRDAYMDRVKSGDG
ncbi:MAG: pyridoxamine 5'-phosphate oxidase family protein [Pseudomonadota bacterium]